MRRARHWRELVIALVGMLLASLLAMLSALRPTQIVLNMGMDRFPNGVQIAGFHGAETQGAFPFRWTQGRAQVRLPSTEWNRLQWLDVQMLGLKDPQGRLPTVTVSMEQQVLGRGRVVAINWAIGSPYHYTFLIPARSPLATEYTLVLESPTVVPGGGDPRALGVAVEEITLTSMPGLGWPPLPTLLAMLIIVPLAYGMGRLLRWPKRTVRIAAAEVVLLLGIALVAAPLDMASLLPAVIGGLAAAGLLAFSLPRFWRWAWPRVRIALRRSAARVRRQWTDSRLSRWRGRASRRLAAIEDGLPPTASTARSRVPWADLGAIAFLLVAILGVFYPFVLQGKLFWGMDITYFFYPTRAVLSEALREGNPGLVIWNPYIFAGYPLLAEGQTGTFYPLNWLFAQAIIPLDIFLTVHLILHYFLAATFTYLFARTLRIGRLGAIVAGLTYAFCGFMVAHLQHVSLQNAAAWLPLLFLFTELLLTRRRWFFLPLASLTLAIQICAGHPQAALICLLGLAIYLFARLLLFSGAPPEQAGPGGVFLDPRRRLGALPLAISNLVRFCALMGLLVVLGVALAAIQLLPLYELIDHSVRAGGITYEWASAYALSPADLLTLIFPFRTSGTVQYVGPWNFGELAFYAGIAPLVLTLASVLKPNRYVLLFLFLGGLTLLLAMGSSTPLFRLLHALPIYSGLRAPARFVLLVDFSLALLAGFGLTILQQRMPVISVGAAHASPSRSGTAVKMAPPSQQAPGKTRGRPWFYAALLLSLLAVVIGPGGVGQAAWKALPIHWGAPAAIESPYTAFFPLVDREVPGNGLSPLRLVGDLQSANPYRWLPWLLLPLSLGLAAVGYRWRGKPWVAPLFVVLLLVDLATFTWEVTSTVVVLRPAEVPGAAVEQTAAFLKTEGDRFYAYHMWDWPTNELMPAKIPFLDGYSPLELSRYLLYDGEFRSHPANISLLSLASVRYLVDVSTSGNLPGVSAPQGSPSLLFDQAGIQVQENPAALPRAYVVYSATVVREEQVLQVLTRPGWDPATAAVLEEPAPLPPPSGTVTATTEIRRRDPMSVELYVSSAITGLLVLNDTYYPGWEARVDGTPTSIYRANYLFRAVLVPPGDHTVVFVYRPLTLYVGAAITALAVIGTVGTGGVLALRHRRRGGKSRRSQYHATFHRDSGPE